MTTNSSILYRNKNTQMGLNQQLHDMGVSEHDLFNIEVINKEIERIKMEFDFVMIAEFFEESMVLLAHYLCWPLEWVTGINHNVRKPDTKVQYMYNMFINTLQKILQSVVIKHSYTLLYFLLQVDLSEVEKSTLSRWQRGDEFLYHEFEEIFQNRVKEYGLERMEKVS